MSNMKPFGCFNFSGSVVITGCYCPTPTRGNQDVNWDVIITEGFTLTVYIYIITPSAPPPASHFNIGWAGVTNSGWDQPSP